MAQGKRIDKVAGLVQTTLASILLRESSEHGFGMVTITNVSLSKDFSSAKVFVSVMDDDHTEDAIAALNKAAPSLRYLLAKSKIEMRVIPSLKFIFDDSIVKGSRISSLLNDALKNKEIDEE